MGLWIRLDAFGAHVQQHNKLQTRADDDARVQHTSGSASCARFVLQVLVSCWSSTVKSSSPNLSTVAAWVALCGDSIIQSSVLFVHFPLYYKQDISKPQNG